MKEINFRPKARLIKILGEQLIKDASVGIIELVKNSYDADATEVELIFDSLNTENAKIIIRDNGAGMNTETFLTKWMNPASGHKEVQKNRKIRTSLGRLPLGEKGVGRFAAQQIGNKLTLISKNSIDKKILSAWINWEEFDSAEKDLSQINIRYEESENSDFFPGNNTGTVLIIEKIRDKFSESDVKKIYSAIRRMKSPFRGANNFNVTISFENCLKEWGKYSDLNTSEILEKAPFTFIAIADDNGIVDWEYKFSFPGFKKRENKGKSDLFQETDITINKDIKIGSFMIYLHAYLRGEPLKITQINPKDIDELSGISVYRDGIRILPYGEKGNDWLGLDNRRIQNPGQRIGNDQVIGMVEINQNENSILKDKTNREGLIEDKYYEKFTKLITGVITLFERELYEDRKLFQKKQRKVEENIIKDKLNTVERGLNQIEEKVQEKSEVPSVDIKETLNHIKPVYHELKTEIPVTIEELENEKKVLFNLAGTGLAAERFTHEFARIIGGALTSLDRLKKLIDLKDPKVKKETDTLTSALEVLRNDIRLLGPMFYIKKVAKEKELDIRKIIDNTVSLQEHMLTKENINLEITGGTFTIVMREGSLMQVFNNLLDNAIFWCSRKSESDKKRIRIIIDDKDYTVYVTDSGPGINSRFRDKIFDPFFSMKGEDGRGLGLYIVKEILDEKGFGIWLVNQEDYPGLLSGASFKIVFNEKSE
uniref:histidine kinase n=1 Tax=Ignavibacterium album TaxID=591197 RepID=A0A7V2ZLC0_9BACT